MVDSTQSADPTGKASGRPGPTPERRIDPPDQGPAARITDSEEFIDMSTLIAPRPTHRPATRDLPALPERHIETRGFALYLGLDEAKAAEDGVSLAEIADRIKALVAEIAPHAQTHATVAIAPIGAGGRDIDVVRTALHDPALAKRREAELANQPKRRTGIIVDISRKRVIIDGEVAGLTYKEFELLRFLVLREGRTVEREEIIAGLWAGASDEETPNARTIDVHIRRLRSKLGDYEDIVRTVRGAGYRFDRHADVSIQYPSAPSPDVF